MTCGGCVGTTVGGLTGLFSKSLCGWCAVDGHSSNIGYCVGSVSMCKTLQTSVLKKNFGPGGRVRFNDGITAMTQWRCPDEMEMLVRSCERGCDLRCDEQKKEEWYVCVCVGWRISEGGRSCWAANGVNGVESATIVV